MYQQKPYEKSDGKKSVYPAQKRIIKVSKKKNVVPYQFIEVIDAGRRLLRSVVRYKSRKRAKGNICVRSICTRHLMILLCTSRPRLA